jgi:hypothetical protein
MTVIISHDILDDMDIIIIDIIVAVIIIIISASY